MARAPGKTIVNKALQAVTSTKSSYKAMNAKRREQLAEIYREVMSYAGEKQADWSSTLKVNFANQIESLVTARLTAKNPKFIVSLRQNTDAIVDRYFKVSKEPGPEAGPQEMAEFAQKKVEREKFKNEVDEWATAIQDYLNFAFDEYGFNAKIRQGAKSLVRYGNVYGTVDYKHDVFRKKRDGKIEEVKADEYPALEIVSWTEVYLDPRFIQVSDAPSVIWEHDKVRLGELYAQKEDLFHLDKIKLINSNEFNSERQEVYQLMITSATTGETEAKKVKYLTIDKFYGYFNPTKNPENEGIYEIWTVNDAIVIKVKEIPRIPVHSAGCFEDVEQHYSIGYIEPILGLQREYNFKLNSAVEYINQSLNRSYMWDPNSGVNPKTLSNLGPGSIIPATKGIENALTGVQEIPHRDINQSYFANSNEVRRDMQSLTFTVDTTAPTSTQGFTNTATAVRARFFESNVMYSDTLKHYEEFIVRLAYDMLDAIAENAKEDIIIAKMGEGRFKWANKEIFEDAPLRYAIRVEVGSSSFDTIENRREDALAFWTVLKEAAAAGADVDLNKGVEEIIRSFERKESNDFIKKDFSSILGLIGDRAPAPQVGVPTVKETAAIAVAEPTLSNPAELTKAVVQGKLTA